MDANHFDTLVKSFSTPDTRRGLLRGLAALLLASGLHRFLGKDAAGQGNGAIVGGGGRRQRRKARHRHDPGKNKENRKGKRKGCKHPSAARSCAGTCGTVRNKCGKRVDCGSCSTGLCCDGACQDVACCNAAGCQAGQDCRGGSCCTMAGNTATTAAPCCAGLNTCADGTCCDGCCGSDGTCCPGCCGSDGTCGACLVFVTSTRHTGNLGGLSRADAICQDLAESAPTPLPGTYKAWLSDSTGSPATRFRQSALGYTRVDGITVAASWADLTDGTLDAPIDLTELGTFPSGANVVWTHTLPDGTAGGNLNEHCLNWSTGDPSVSSGDIGFAIASDARWTAFADFHCDTLLPLYCFQQT